ncbi:MAG TPA: hypothetical protein VFQ61_06315 [Polyangiaceae bacterium]|nr:hypothetical protein [Polyangiaceae bacterium]
MRTIKLLEPITIREIDGSPALIHGQPLTVSMVHFLASRLRDVVFGQSLETLEHCKAIGDALVSASPSLQELTITDPAWRLLAHAVRTPGLKTQYDPLVGVNLLPFMRAVMTAELSDQLPVNEPQPEQLPVTEPQAPN